MKFFDKIFDINDTSDYNISGLNRELTCINIYNTFISNNKGILVVTDSTYIGNIIYQTLLNYTDRVLFFPMDDFLTSEAIAISPEFKVERINTLNILASDSKYIVVTNLMGALRYLPRNELWQNWLSTRSLKILMQFMILFTIPLPISVARKNLFSNWIWSSKKFL